MLKMLPETRQRIRFWRAVIFILHYSTGGCCSMNKTGAGSQITINLKTGERIVHAEVLDEQ